MNALLRLLLFKFRFEPGTWEIIRFVVFLAFLTGGEGDAAVAGGFVVKLLVRIVFTLERVVGLREARDFFAGAVGGDLVVEVAGVSVSNDESSRESGRRSGGGPTIQSRASCTHSPV